MVISLGWELVQFYGPQSFLSSRTKMAPLIQAWDLKKVNYYLKQLRCLHRYSCWYFVSRLESELLLYYSRSFLMSLKLDDNAEKKAPARLIHVCFHPSAPNNNSGPWVKVAKYEGGKDSTWMATEPLQKTQNGKRNRRMTQYSLYKI